jgi:hypothetical protein
MESAQQKLSPARSRSSDLREITNNAAARRKLRISKRRDVPMLRL